MLGAQALTMSRQHNIVPELPLVSRVTHVALAFMRSEVFNVPQQDKWPLFTSIADVRPKFATGTKMQVAIGGWGNTDGFSEAVKTNESRRLFAGNIKAMIDATGADGGEYCMFLTRALLIQIQSISIGSIQGELLRHLPRRG
jgi:hypothetical protein